MHLLNFAEDTNRVDLIHVFPFAQGEIWDINASPYDKTVIACSYQSTKDFSSKIEILKMPEINHEDPDEALDENMKLDSLVTLKSQDSLDDPLLSIQWEDNEA